MLQNTGIRIGYLGPAGTYSEEAAQLFSQQIIDAGVMPFSDIQAVIRAVAEGKIERGVVPLENSIEGSVNITLDTLAHDVELFIVREIILPIRHSLFAKDSLAPVEIIASHSQALAQCRRYLELRYPNAVIRAVESTAAAAEMAAKGLVSAAIASTRAGQLFGLRLLDQDIQDTHCNQTRFVALSRQPETEGATKMSLVCRIRGDKPGTLYDMISEFAKRGVNLTRIESRPARTGLGEYIFFIDLDGTMSQPLVAEAVRQVAANSLWLKNLGMYGTSTMYNQPTR
jgi:prephenate dehydratase